MAQSDILRVIKKNSGKWLSSYEIAIILGKSRNKVTAPLSRVCKMDVVQRRHRSNVEYEYCYGKEKN